MLSLPALLIICLSIAVSLRGVIDTRCIVRYDVGASLMVLVWLVPQMIAIELGSAKSYFETEPTFWFIFLCLLTLNIGFLCGTRYNVREVTRSVVPFSAYDQVRLGYATFAIGVVGLAAVYLMVVEAQSMGENQQWTGVVTFYFLLSQILIIAGAIGLIHYLYSGRKVGALVYLTFLAAAIPIAFLLVRRSVLFELAVVSLGAYIFVRHFKAPRLAVIASAVVGAIVLNGAGDLRNYVAQEDGNLVTALSAQVVGGEEVLESENPAAELRSAIADVELARQSGNYEPFVMLWNLSVSQYIPAFIVGQQVKQSYLIQSEEGRHYRDFSMTGATRTGFAEAFSGYWYFGLIFFFIIPFIFGRLWVKANAGDVKSQIMYLIFLLYGLLIITESISRLIVTAPIFWTVIQCVLLYGRKPRPVPRLRMA